MAKNIFEKIYGLYETEIDLTGSEQNKMLVEEMLSRKLSFFEAFFAMYYDVFGHCTRVHGGKHVLLTTQPHSGVSKFLFFLIGFLSFGALIFGYSFEDVRVSYFSVSIILPISTVVVVRLVGFIKHSVAVARIQHLREQGL